MKWVVLLSILFLNPDLYFVSHVNGTVLKAGSRKPIKVGDQILLNDTLIFSSPQDFVQVVSPKTGCYTMKPKRIAGGTAPNTVWAVLKENLLPALQSKPASTRPGIMNSIEDIAAYFTAFITGDSARYLVVGKQLLMLNKQSFNDRKKRFFFIRYGYKGEEINKRLAFIEPASAKDTLSLQLDGFLFTIDHRAINPNAATDMKLFYYDSENETSLPVCDVPIAWVDEKQVLKELAIVCKYTEPLFSGKTNKKELISDQLLSHLLTCYGRPDGKTFTYLLTQIL